MVNRHRRWTWSDKNDSKLPLLRKRSLNDEKKTLTNNKKVMSDLSSGRKLKRNKLLTNVRNSIFVMVVIGVLLLIGFRQIQNLNLSQKMLNDMKVQKHEVLQPQKYLKFSVCNGFANQRLGIAFGIITAKILRRVAILPDLISDGTQQTSENISSERNKTLFSEFYDADHFVQKMKEINIDVIQNQNNSFPETFYKVNCENEQLCLNLLKRYKLVRYVYLECPFGRPSLSPSDVFENRQIFTRVLQSLIPNEKLQSIIKKSIQRLKFIGTVQEFNFIHIRAEPDWIAHCDRWQKINDGIVRDNCMNNTFELGSLIESKGFSKDKVVYLASSWEQISPVLSDQITSNIRRKGYKTIQRMSILPTTDLPRDQLALVEYYIGLYATKTIGNSVSSFTALMILERQQRQQWASYYNGGDIPLGQMVPLFKLPWIFAYNSWSPQNDYLTKAAVVSAIQIGGFDIYCLFSGERDSDIYVWLEKQGVTMIVHNPTWMTEILSLNDHANLNLQYSHLYADPEAMIGTFQRIDIPILEELQQFNFVFYTDTDIFFLQPIQLQDFPKPLPKSIGMGPEMLDKFPYNAGIALWNMQSMRQSYDQFITWLLEQKNHLYFDGYGPLDQGALNKFYETTVKQWKLPKEFNARVYQEVNSDARVLHFHGPKPKDFVEFLDSGNCRFQSMCKMGVDNSLCVYITRWWEYVQQDNPEGFQIAQKLVSACQSTEKKAQK